MYRLQVTPSLRLRCGLRPSPRLSARIAALLAAAILSWISPSASLAGDPPAAVSGRRPAEILSWRHQVLAREQYAAAARAWEAYVAAHPQDAGAWVHWGHALRYSGAHQEAREKYQRAFEVDSTDIVALEGYASFRCTEMESSAPGEREVNHQRLLRAALMRPDYARTYYMLWATSLMLGEEELAGQCLSKMVALGDMPRPLLDFGYNLIAGAPEGAIVFTNGDNDTYPPLAVQHELGQRRDVAIVNLSLLNTAWYIRYLRDHGLPITLDDAAIGALRPSKESLVSAQMQRHIFDNLMAAGWPRALFYAVTVYEGQKTLPCKCVVEGLLERIVPAAGDEIGTRSYDLARVRELLDTAYRIDGMSDPLVDWKRESAVAMLGMNYVTLMHALGESLLESSPAEAAAYLYNVCALLSFHRRREQAQAICAAWREKDPESALLHRAQALVGALEAGE